MKNYFKSIKVPSERFCRPTMLFCWAGKGEYLADFSCQSKSYLRTSTTTNATNTFLERRQKQPWLQCILIYAGIEAVSRSEQMGGIRRMFLQDRGSV